MYSIQSSKNIYTPLQGYHDSPHSSLITSPTAVAKPYPLSAGSGNIVGVPGCINHKRKKSQYVVSLSDGQGINFCERCMQAAERQGFKGVKVSEFHGTLRSKYLNQMQKNNDVGKKVELLHNYLDELKQLEQQVSTLKDTLQSSLNLVFNSNDVQTLLQRLQIKIRQLKEDYHTKIAFENRECSKICQEMRSKTIWIEQDLEYLISKVCRHYDKLLVEPEETFKVHMSLMHQSLKQQEKHLQQLKVQFTDWRHNTQIMIKSLNHNFCHRYKKLWQESFLDCSISNIGFDDQNEEEMSPPLFKIIQELSTTQTFAQN